MSRFAHLSDLSIWEIVARALVVALGCGFVFYPLWLMLHGEFTFYAARRPGWIFAPPLIFIGFVFISWALRDYNAADKTAGDEDSESTTPRIDSK